MATVGYGELIGNKFFALSFYMFFCNVQGDHIEFKILKSCQIKRYLKSNFIGQ